MTLASILRIKQHHNTSLLAWNISPTPEGGPFLSSDIRQNKIPDTAKDVGIAWKRAVVMACLA